MAYLHSSLATGSNNSTVSEMLCPLPVHDTGDLVVVVIGSRHD